MDINKPITNPNLVNAIEEIKQGNKKEELFWDEVFKAEFLCPINMEIGKISQKENYKIVLGEGTSITLLSIDNEQSEHFLMAFTDWEELKKWKQNHDQQTLILSYEDYQGIIIKNDSPYQGMVINPYGQNIVLDRQMLTNTRKNEQIIQKGESVMLGIPKEYPTDMVNKLKEYFVKMQNVDKAHLLWMVRDKESSYLLVLDSKISPQQLFPLIGQICQPFLNGKLLDMVLANSGLGKSAIEGQAPFFVR